MAGLYMRSAPARGRSPGIDTPMEPIAGDPEASVPPTELAEAERLLVPAEYFIRGW